MIALGFMLEEPDTNSDIRLCSVFVHQMMPLPLLTGVITLLKCFLGKFTILLMRRNTSHSSIPL